MVKPERVRIRNRKYPFLAFLTLAVPRHQCPLFTSQRDFVLLLRWTATAALQTFALASRLKAVSGRLQPPCGLLLATPSSRSGTKNADAQLGR